MNSYDTFSLNDEGHQEEIITPTLGLLAQSKRITKKSQKQSAFQDDVCKAPKATAGRKGTKYDTFDSEEQENLMAMLQKEVKDFCDDQDWHNALVNLPAKEYRPILAAVIPKFRPSFKSTDKNQMNQMWKKVKNLVVKKSQGKSEKRGEPIILDHELPYFKEQVKAIIKTLKNKKFEDFRQRLLPVIQQIRTQGGRSFDPNVFKKHKWSDFVNDPENSDIKAAWKKLKRASSNDNSDANECDQFSSLESSDNATMASSQDISPINSLESPHQDMMKIVIDNLPIDNDQAFPVFEDDFGCVIDVPGFLSYESQEVENNFGPQYEAPIHEGCPGYGTYDVDQYFAFGSKHENEKILIEDDNSYKQQVFEGMRNGSYQWGY